MAEQVLIRPDSQILDLRTGKLTREGFRFLLALNNAVSDATSDFVLLTATQTLTNKTIDGDVNTLQDIAYSSIKSTSRTGLDTRLVTGTAGTNGNLAQWNADGDAVDSAVPTSTVLVDGDIGGSVQGYDATLAALAAYNTNGLLAQTAADTFAGRTLTGTASQITVSNGDGVAGNPTLSLPADVLVPTVITAPNTGLHLLDTDASHDLIIAPGSNLTADRTLTVTTGDANHTIDISGAPTNVVIATGVYTPTLTNTTNVAASTAYECSYLRLGNKVYVWGRADIDPTTSGANTVLGISVPVASNLAATTDLGGSAGTFNQATGGAGIQGDATNDRAEMQFIAPSANNTAWGFSFGYTVI